MIDKIQTYIDWINDAISNIEKYTKWMSFEEFSNDWKTIDACLMQLIHIWETVKRLHEKHPNYWGIPVRPISWLRNIITHDYMSIDKSAIRNAITIDLPKLKKTISSK